MAGPGDEMAAAQGGGRGHLRASHADREQVIEVLKDAFVQGRLTRHELDVRAGRAFTSRCYGELAVLTADIPVGPTGAEPPPKPVQVQARARPRVSAEVKAGGRAIAAIYLTAGVLWVGAMLAGDNAVGGAFFFLAFIISAVAVFFTLYGAVVLIHSLRDKPSTRQPPPNAHSQVSGNLAA